MITAGQVYKNGNTTLEVVCHTPNKRTALNVTVITTNAKGVRNVRKVSEHTISRLELVTSNK